ncbi:ubiquitin domain-containing protein [Aspergillus undulatus]|uniref:ubiquitin domain-containing protein n=1 Tax=Aspergillus undulatus TaxID=1810928 RepID=UPI003CCE1D63
MGCCFSVSRDPTAEDHDRHDTPHNSTTANPRPNQPTHRSSSLLSHSQTDSPSSSRQRQHTSSSSVHGPNHRSRTRQHASTTVPLTQHINAPIRPHVWTSKKRLWTRALLDRERTEFFETRVTGRAEVWAALSAALTFMRAGDFGTAQSIVDAAGVTVPTGDLCQGVYDEQGVLYRLPRCIVSDPENIVAGDLSEEEEDRSRSGGDTDEEDHEDGDGEVDVGFETDDRKGGFRYEDEVESGDELIGDGRGRGGSDDLDERERRRDEKGKTSERDLIRVKARLSDRDGADVVVAIKKTQNVGFLARKVQQEVGVSLSEIPRTQRVRIAYLGKILKEHTSLIDQGWKPGNILYATSSSQRKIGLCQIEIASTGIPLSPIYHSETKHLLNYIRPAQFQTMNILQTTRCPHDTISILDSLCCRRSTYFLLTSPSASLNLA